MNKLLALYSQKFCFNATTERCWRIGATACTSTRYDAQCSSRKTLCLTGRWTWTSSAQNILHRSRFNRPKSVRLHFRCRRGKAQVFRHQNRQNRRAPCSSAARLVSSRVWSEEERNGRSEEASSRGALFSSCDRPCCAKNLSSGCSGLNLLVVEKPQQRTRNASVLTAPMRNAAGVVVRCRQRVHPGPLTIAGRNFADRYFTSLVSLKEIHYWNQNATNCHGWPSSSRRQSFQRDSGLRTPRSDNSPLV